MLDGFFKKALGDLKSAYCSKTEKCESLKRQREELANAPGTREDVIDYICAQIDRDASTYSKRLERTLTQFGYLREDYKGTNGEPASMGFLTARPHNGDAHFRDIEANLPFFFGAELKRGAENAVRAIEKWPKNAQPRKGREAKLQKLDKEISALEDEIKSMRRDAAESGVVL